jgi:hypothetical protein
VKLILVLNVVLQVDEKKKLTWQSGESRVTNENVTNKPLVKRLGCS